MFLSRGVNWAHRIGNRGHLMVGASLVGLGFSSRWCRKTIGFELENRHPPQKNVHHINGDPHFHRLFFPKSLHQEFTPPHHQKVVSPFERTRTPRSAEVQIGEEKLQPMEKLTGFFLHETKHLLIMDGKWWNTNFSFGIVQLIPNHLNWRF